MQDSGAASGFTTLNNKQTSSAIPSESAPSPHLPGPVMSYFEYRR
jgi:hypothetical protein